MHAHATARATGEPWRRKHEEAGVPGRHVHKQAGAQFAYNNKLAEMCGEPALPPWRKALWDHTMALWGRYAPNEYRDHWDDNDTLAVVYKDIDAIPLLEDADS